MDSLSCTNCGSIISRDYVLTYCESCGEYFPDETLADQRIRLKDDHNGDVSRQYFCRSCGRQVLEKGAVCLSCGMRADDGTAFCQGCGAATKARQVLCITCGVELRPESNELRQVSKFGGAWYVAGVFSLAALALVAIFVLWESTADKQLAACVSDVKQGLNDPASFEIVSKSGRERDDGTFLLIVEYTARNSFGGRVRSSASCGFKSREDVTLNSDDFQNRIRSIEEGLGNQ